MNKKFFKRTFKITPRVSVWIIYLSMLFFKIIGLLTPSVRSESDQEHGNSRFISIRSSKIGIVYNIILLILYLGSQILALPMRIFNYPGKSLVTENVHKQETFTSILAVFALLISYCSNQKLMIRVGKQLIDLQKIFDREKILHEHGVVLPCAITVTIIYLLIFTAYCSITFVLCLDTGNSKNVIFCFLLDLFSLFTICFSLIQYFLAVCIIHAKFEDLNKSIATLPMMFKQEFPRILLDEVHGVLPSASFTSQIAFIKDIYNRLLDLSNIVNESFSVPIYFSVMYIAIRIINTTFYIVAIMMSHDSRKYLLVASPATCLIIVLLPISSLAFTVTAFKKEAAQTAHVVHDLLNSTKDQNLISELELFSLQLLHGKPQFTAWEFYHLDCSLLRGLIAAVITYIVILVQFQAVST